MEVLGNLEDEKRQVLRRSASENRRVGVLRDHSSGKQQRRIRTNAIEHHIKSKI